MPELRPFAPWILAALACSPHVAEPASEPAAPPAPAAAPARDEAPTAAEPGAAPGGFTSFAAGVHHTCAVRGGELRCWGLNRGGLLGVGEPDLANVLTPRPVPGLGRVVEVIANYDYSCALTEDRAVHCWGDNDSGQLGVGDLDPRGAPTRVVDLAADRLFVGHDRVCAALGPDVRCWGSGEFGDGVQRSRVTRPLEIPELAHLGELALGDAHSCALRSGEVRCWGHNDRGQLGNGEGGCRYTRERCPQSRCLPPRECKHEPLPVVAAGLPPIVELRIGGSQTHARDADGRVWVSGQQGTSMDYGADNPHYRQRVVEGLPPVVELAAGGGHACARTAAGEVWCWGANAFGQLGRPPAARGGAEAPGRVPGLPPASRLALGSNVSCAIAGEGAAAAAWCWGDNGVGQLGDGTTERRHAPVRVRWE